MPKGGTIGKPTASNGFVSNAQVPGLVIAEARWSPGQKFDGLDVLDEEQLIAVFVKIGLPSKSADEQDVQLTPEQMEFRLQLQDGTVLDAISPESAVKGDEKLTTALVDKALQHGFLKLSGGVKEGFVYFKLRPKDDFEVDGRDVVHVAGGGVRRELDLSRSLLSFQLTRGGQSTPFFIGVAR